MKKFIPIAISFFMMAAPMFFTSCSNDDNLIPDEIGVSQYHSQLQRKRIKDVN